MFSAIFKSSTSAKNTALEYTGGSVRIKAHIYNGFEDVAEEVLGYGMYIPEIDAKFFECRPKLLNRVIFVDNFEVDIFMPNDTQSASVEFERFISAAEDLYETKLIVVVPTWTIRFDKICGNSTIRDINRYTKFLLEDDCNMTNRNFLGYPSVYVGDYYNLLMSKRHRDIEIDDDCEEEVDE